MWGPKEPLKLVSYTIEVIAPIDQDMNQRSVNPVRVHLVPEEAARAAAFGSAVLDVSRAVSACPDAEMCFFSAVSGQHL